MMDKTVTCNRCGWVHFTVTRAHALKEIASFKEYYDGLSDEDKDMFAPPAHIEDYEQCMLCGNHYMDFRPFTLGDCPDGSTLNPILEEEWLDT